MKKKNGIALSLDAVGAMTFMIIIASILMVKGPSFIENSRNTRAETDAVALGGSVSEYKMEIGHYPDTINSLTQTNGQYSSWILKVPTDPWGNTYQYKKTDTKFVVYSFGPDKADSGSSAETGVAKGDIGFAGR